MIAEAWRGTQVMLADFLAIVLAGSALTALWMILSGAAWFICRVRELVEKK